MEIQEGQKSIHRLTETSRKAQINREARISEILNKKDESGAIAAMKQRENLQKVEHDRLQQIANEQFMKIEQVRKLEKEKLKQQKLQAQEIEKRHNEKQQEIANARRILAL